MTDTAPVELYDVSSWNPKTPNLRTTGRGGLLVRKCYGSRPDALYAMHAGNVRTLYPAAVLASYIFGRSSLIVPIASQVAAFLDGNKSDLLVLDLEHDASGFLGFAAAADDDMGPKPMQAGRDGALELAAASTTVSMSPADARHFVTAVHSHGRQIWLYHSLFGFPDVGQDGNWPAAWRTTPPPASIYRPGRDFWQYNADTIDKDRYNGTLAQLYAMVGRAPSYTLHIAKGAKVRSYDEGPGGCLKKPYHDSEPWPKDSHAPANGPVLRAPCDGGTRVTTARVLDGAFEGKRVRIGFGTTLTKNP